MPSKAPGAHSSLMKRETDRPGEWTRAREREKGGDREGKKNVLSHSG